MPLIPQSKKLPGNRLRPVVDTAHPLVKRLYALYVAEGIQITELSRMSGVSRSMLWGWFQNKKYGIQIKDLEAVLHVLGYQLKIVPLYSEEIMQQSTASVPLGTIPLADCRSIGSRTPRA